MDILAATRMLYSEIDVFLSTVLRLWHKFEKKTLKPSFLPFHRTLGVEDEEEEELERLQSALERLCDAWMKFWEEHL